VSSLGKNNLKKKSLIENTLWSSLDYLFNRLAIIAVTNIIIARVLSPSNYGIFSTALTLVQSLWIVVDFGITQYGIREAAKTADVAARHRLARGLYSFRLLMALTALLLLVFATLLLPIADQWRFPLILSGLYLFFFSLLPDWYFKANLRFRAIFFSNSISALIYLLLVLLFVNSCDDLNTACFLWAISFLPTSIILLTKIHYMEGRFIRFPGRGSLAKILPHLNESRHFFVLALFSNLYISIPVYLLTALASTESIGYFNANYRIFLLLSSMLLPLSHVFYPVLSGSFSRKGGSDFLNKLNLFQHASQLLILPAILITWLYGHDIILLFYGEGYEVAAWILSYLSIPILFTMIRLPLSNAVAASGNQRFLAVVSILMSIFSLFSGYLLIGNFGLRGAVVSIIIAETLFMISLVSLSIRLLPIPGRKIFSGFSWKVILGIAPSSIIWWRLDFSLPTLFAGMAAYVIFLLLMGEIDIFKRTIS
jgi:O-antigen/teichoic acid export membrane protein